VNRDWSNTFKNKTRKRFWARPILEETVVFGCCIATRFYVFLPNVFWLTVHILVRYSRPGCGGTAEL